MEVPSTITIHVPSVLRDWCGGSRLLTVNAVDMRELIGQLERQHPALYRSICDETGAIRRHINLFVNSSHVRDRRGLDTPLAPGDVVTLMTAVSGG